MQIITRLLIFLIIFSLGMGVGSKYITKTSPEKTIQHAGLSSNKAFVGEVYDKIKENYWDNISDEDLLKLFSQTLGGKELKTKDQLLSEIKDAKIATYAAGLVLANLKPAGRSGLYTQKSEEALKNIVNNVNPEKDLYKDLGLAKGASSQAVQAAFQKKAEDLKKEDTPQAKKQLKQITYANNVLTKPDSKTKYDTSLVEPTIFTKTIGSILYVQFKKFSPTSYDEFIKAFESHKNDSNLTGLIFDLRGNIGGAIDATPYFLGNFLGKGAYAYEFYQKGEYLPFKTPTDKLASLTRFKQVVVLVDNNTQSSSELMAVTFKKYHVGVVMGSPTKGWGTVERVFPLENQISKTEKYSIFLVHSITLRDDNLPIEGRGVEPDINIKNPDWQNELNKYFNYPQLASTVADLYNFGEPPR